jgi:hypothetical protein
MGDKSSIYSRLSLETMERIATEVTLKMESATPDTPDEKEFRKRVAKDIAQIKADGRIVDVTSDWPEVDE